MISWLHDGCGLRLGNPSLGSAGGGGTGSGVAGGRVGAGPALTSTDWPPFPCGLSGGGGATQEACSGRRMAYWLVVKDLACAGNTVGA